MEQLKALEADALVNDISEDQLIVEKKRNETRTILTIYAIVLNNWRHNKMLCSRCSFGIHIVDFVILQYREDVYFNAYVHI